MEMCFLDNSNMRTNAKYTNTNNNYYINNINIDTNKIKKNLANNTLTMYRIYILSKYYEKCDNIGLIKILLFDRNERNIPIICYNTNCNLNNK